MDLSPTDQFHKDIEEYSLWDIINSLEGIANLSKLSTTPGNIKQAKDNLKGLKILILSCCAQHGVE
jgi:hypothetical protein